MNSIGLKPFIGIINDNFKVDSLHFGDSRRCFEKYVDYAIPRWSRPDPELLFVTYSDVSEEDLRLIEKRIRSRAHFDNIIFQKATAALALSCGSGAFGVLYMEQSDTPYHFAKMIEGYNAIAEEPSKVSDSSGNKENALRENAGDDDRERTGNPSVDVKEKWYARIEGIDPVTAIANSGSEDAFLSVLKIFYDSIDSKKEEICTFYDRENFADYTIKVHALKSSARLVGAVSMSKDAEALEMAGKAGDLEYIRQHHDALIKELSELKGRLSGAYEKDAASEDKGEDKADAQDLLSAVSSQNFDEFMINGMYDAISLGVEKRNEKILKGTFLEMADYSFPEEHQKIFEDLRERFEKGDYSGMEEILASRK